MKRNLQILQYFKLIGKVFAITCLFVLLQTNNKAIAYYQTPEFSVTLKCVGWTNPLDTTVVNATMSIREWATNSIYIRNFSNSFREIYYNKYAQIVHKSSNKCFTSQFVT